MNPELDLVEISPVVEPSLPEIPWTDGRDDTWRNAPPLFELRAEEGDLSACGWMALSPRDILFRVTVRKATHANRRNGHMIYDGDSVQIGIDARGDGRSPGSAAPNTCYVGPDDGYFGFALTSSGVEVWAYHLRENLSPAHIGYALPETYARIARDDAAGATEYDIAIPWKELNTPAGFSPVMGVCVQVNTGEHRTRRLWVWGDTGSGDPQPDKMKRVRIAPPAGEINLIADGKTEIWMAEDFGRIPISRWSAGPCRLRAALDGRVCEFDLPAVGAGANRQYAVRAFPRRATGEPAACSVQLLDGAGRELAAHAATLCFPGNAVDDLRRRLEELASRAAHPLVRRSLESMRQAVDWEWDRALTEIRGGGGTPWAVDTLAWINELMKHASDDLVDWDAYREGKCALTVAFPSPAGSDLRIYKVNLPRDYDPSRAYPAVYFLHGAGLVHGLQHVASDISPLEKNLHLSGEAARRERFFEFRLFVGQMGYWGDGEAATWEQIEHIERTFRVDPDRRSLTGGSMGGMGAWSLGLRTPDRWASICVIAGCANGNQMGTDRPGDVEIGLGRNAAGLAVRIDHGAEDLLVPTQCAYEMRGELARWGAEPEMHVYEGAGHGLPPGAYDQTVVWMLGHARRRPAKFAFVADTDRYLGCWGVNVQRDSRANPLPAFECEICERTVTLRSQGAQALEVNLGEGGLGLAGEVNVIWNDKPVYRGEARVVTLT